MTRAEHATRTRALGWWTLAYMFWLAGCLAVTFLVLDSVTAGRSVTQFGIGMAMGLTARAFADSVEWWIVRRRAR